MLKHKIKTIPELAQAIADEKAAGRRVVLCHGNFDLLHIGHIRYFKQARRLGDVLVVTVTPDRFVDKGPDRPAFGQDLRLEAVASLGCVDYAAINDWKTAEETLRTLRPDVYAKGSEFENIVDDPTGKMALEAEVCAEIGCELAFTHDMVFSSSNLINRFLDRMPEEIRQYLGLFRSRYSIADCVDTLEAMARLRVLVLGDAILDEYHYCKAIGKSSKDPALALLHEATDLFAGGVFATANHAAGFCREVGLVSVLGEADARDGFIRSKLRPNVAPHFAMQPNAPTTRKSRFIDGYSTNKLLEVYTMDDSGLPEDRDAALNADLARMLPEYDLAIVSDFGHGMVSPRTVATLAQGARFLAVNTQANAGNRGFNTISKYPRMDYACLAEHELRLEARDSSGAIRPHMERLVDRLGCAGFVVTRGRRGCEIATSKGDFVKVPSFATNVVDRIGAGDALFAITSMAASLGADPELVAFIGNVVGGLAVQVIGNEKPIGKDSVQKYITSLLK